MLATTTCWWCGSVKLHRDKWGQRRGFACGKRKAHAPALALTGARAVHVARHPQPGRAPHKKTLHLCIPRFYEADDVAKQ